MVTQKPDRCSNPNNSSVWSTTTEGQNNAEFLTKFRCKDCRKWKSNHQFSKKQLSTYQWKVANSSHSSGPSGASATIRCRQCVGEQVTELQCNGPCGLYKSLQDFSKNQRTQTETAWCIVCIHWREACEPEVEVKPAPNNQLSPDEERELLQSGESIGGFTITPDVIEGDSDSDDEEQPTDYAVMYSSMKSMSVAGEKSNTTSNDEADCLSSNGKTLSSASNPFASVKSGQTRTAENKKDNFGEELSGQESDWSAVDAKRNLKNAGTASNACGSAGNFNSLHQQSISGSTSYSGSTTTERHGRYTINVGKGGWARPDSRKTPANTFPSLDRPTTRQSDYDSDGSGPDEI